MRRFRSNLGWTLLLCAALPAARATDNAALVVPRLPGPVVLDGRLFEDQWRLAARLNENAFAVWKADTYKKDPSRFNLRLFHDGGNLYVSLTSYDRFVQPGAVPHESDGLYSFSAITREGKIQHYRLFWATKEPVPDGEMGGETKWGARLRGPFADPEHEGGGYVLEFAIPFARLGWQAGQTVAVNIIVQDHDGQPGGRHNAPDTEFARFAWGSLDNDNRAAYRKIRLAP